MPISNLPPTPLAVPPPQMGLKPAIKNQPAIKSAAVGAPPVAKDTVTISKAAASLKAAADKQRTAVATATASDPAKAARNDTKQTVRSIEGQAAAVEIQKSTAGNTQEARGTLRISKMI